MYKDILKLFLQWNFFGGPTRIRLTFVCFYLTNQASAPQPYTLHPLKANIPLPHSYCTRRMHYHTKYTWSQMVGKYLKVVTTMPGAAAHFWSSRILDFFSQKIPHKISPNVITAGNCFDHYKQFRRFPLVTTKNMQADVRANTLSTPAYQTECHKKVKELREYAKFIICFTYTFSKSPKKPQVWKTKYQKYKNTFKRT